LKRLMARHDRRVHNLRGWRAVIMVRLQEEVVLDGEDGCWQNAGQKTTGVSATSCEAGITIVEDRIPGVGGNWELRTSRWAEDMTVCRWR
jgi:hypothetical protein